MNRATLRVRAVLAALAAALSLAALSGCSTAPYQAAARPASTPTAIKAAATATPTAERAHRKKRKGPAATARPAGLVACDPNITVRAVTTSCPFAQNVFYAFYEDAISFESQSSIEAYSPVSKEDYAVACATDDADNVTCVAGDGAEVHFNLSAVQAYDDDQAAAYASTHDLGPGHGTATDEDIYSDESDHSDDYAPEDDYSDQSYGADPPLSDRIDNYDNGNGYPVQCADGMWSKSGGIQGACSGHGGVG